MRASTGLALAAINLAAVIFGSTGLFGRLDVSPVWIVAVRGAFAALGLAGVALARRAPLLLPARLALPAAGTGLLLAFHWVTFFLSVQLASVAVATLTFATFPLWTVTLSAAARRQAPRPVEGLAGAAIILAVLLIVDVQAPQGANPGAGVLVGLASAVGFALFSLGSQGLIRVSNMTTLSLNQNLAVTIVLAPALAVFGPAPHGATDWLALAALGVAATALAHQLYFLAMTALPASVCGSFVALEPVYAILMAAALFGEPLTWRLLASGALIVGASLVLMHATRGTRPAAAPPPEP